jgi:hypothetical protein
MSVIGTPRDIIHLQECGLSFFAFLLYLIKGG